MSMYTESTEASREAMDNLLKAISAVTRGFQQIASESTDFTKRSYETSSRMLEQLAQVRSPDKAIELQSTYVRGFYEAWATQTSKTTQILGDVTKEAFKPFESAFNRSASFARDTSSAA